MDITQWLENTADRVPPDQEVDLGFPEFLQAHDEPEHVTRKYRRRKKRASSDSSIIEPRREHHQRGKAANYTHSSGEVRGADHAIARSRSPHSYASSEPDPQTTRVKTYEKRARHKTKPDRYEPNSKKRRKEREAREDGRSRPKRRKSHRSGDGGRTTGLVQSFQLKNGPKNSRLTLKPDTTAGLFKHGRASAQVAGRGAGLPDLVFNEMRFLQKPQEHQDVTTKEGVAEPASKKNRKRQQEEVSAYFTAQGLNTHQGDVQDQERRSRRTIERQAYHGDERREQPAKKVVNPPVELPEKPFLGFGSKGAQPENRDVLPTTDSYYTWSDSAPPPPPARRRISAQEQATHTKSHDDLSEGPRRPLESSTHVERLLSRHRTGHFRDRKVRDDDQLSGNDTWRQSRRTGGPANAEVYRPLAALPRSEDNRCRSGSKTTSQSLPKRPTPEQRDRRLKHAENYRQRRIVSYHTSDILNVKDATLSLARAQLEQHRHERSDGFQSYEKENVEPISSTPTSKLLQQARNAITIPQPVRLHTYVTRTFQDDVKAVSRPSMPKEYDNQPVRANHRVAQELSTQRLGSGLRERCLQSAAGLAQRQMSSAAPSPAAYGHEMTPWLYQDRPAPPPDAVPEDDDMLDNEPETAPLNFEAHYVYANARQVDELVHGIRSDRTAGFYEAQAEQLHPVQPDAPRSLASTKHLSTRTPSIRGLSIAREFCSERSALIADDTGIGTIDEFAGFWKPHKLY